MVSRSAGDARPDPILSMHPWLRKILLVILLAAAAVVVYFVFQRYLRMAATVLLLAALLTYLLQPLVEWLVRASRIRHHHAARTAATLVIYAILGIIFYFVGAGIVRALLGNLRDLQLSWLTAAYQAPQELVQMRDWYLRVVPEDLRLRIAESVNREVAQISDKYVPAAFDSLLGLARQAGEWAAFLVELIFVPLLAFYFLTDASKFREQTLFFVPKRLRQGTIHYARELDRILRCYVHGQVILCAIAWAVVTAAMLLMGIPGALLLGVIAGLSRAIPVIGPIIGGIPLLAAVLISPHWSGAFWWVLIGFTALHFFESKFLMPRILGDHLGVHPVIVVLSLLVGYEMLGLLGMFLAPPAIAMIRVVIATQRDGGVQAVSEQPLLPEMHTLVSDDCATAS